MKTVIVFQGGGALGAFGAGAWQVLAETIDPESIVALAGASIGAVNAAAALRALGEADSGAGLSDALVRLWRERIATPSWPFGGPPWRVVPAGEAAADWSGVLTGLLLGCPGLHQACWPAWQPGSGLDRLQQPLHDRRAMHSLLETLCPPAADAESRPALAVAAVDIMSGELALFDTVAGGFGPEHLAASSAMPLMFAPQSIAGRLHWDGEVTRDSMLPALMQRLLECGRLRRDEACQLVTIEQFPRAMVALPRSGMEIVYRVISLMQLGKLDTPAVEGVRVARHLRVCRPPLPEDGVSGQFDYSPRRIERLIEQGKAAAAQALGD